MTRPNFVYIQGAAFSGSTLLSFALGALEGVLSLGEVHWVAEKKAGCAVCIRKGRQCPVFTPSRLGQLRAAGAEFYRCLRDILPADQILVISDKSPCNWQAWSRNLDLRPVVPLVVFKNPYAQVWSFIKNSGRGGSAGAIDNTLSAVARLYRFKIGSREPLYCDFERLISDPHVVLGNICAHLGLDYRPEAYDRYWEAEQHMVGGNLGPWQRIMQPKAGQAQPLDGKRVVGRLTVDHRWRDNLTPEQMDVISSHPYMQTYHRLVGRFSRQISAPLDQETSTPAA